MAHLCGERTFIIQRFSFVVILERTDLEPFFNLCQIFILKSGRVFSLGEGLLSDAEIKDPNGPQPRLTRALIFLFFGGSSTCLKLGLIFLLAIFYMFVVV